MNKTKIIIHCSATKPSMNIGANEIREWHIARGWSDIGYNGIIKRDGTFEAGRDLDGDGDFLEETGAHARGFNKESIGFCLVGGVDENGQPDSNFTFKQLKTLYEIVNDTMANFGISEVCGHRDLPNVAKACPCFNVEAFFSA